MASYYPEGECYFVRSSLRYSRHWAAENRSDFYSHVLLEYYWNGWVATGNQTRSHQRSQWRHGNAPWPHNTRFGDWDRFWVGESIERNPANMIAIHSHPNSLNWNECRDHFRGGPRKFILRPVQIQRRETEWLWIDATIPLRAIYFPVAHQTDQAHRERVDVMHIAGTHSHIIPVTPHNGLSWRNDLTWGFHVPDIIAYLTIPHKLRNPDQRLFRARNRRDDLVVCAWSSTPWRSSFGITHHPDFFREMDLAQILSATFGVEVGWRPYEPSSFLRNLVVSLIDLGLGFIPGVGPILSVAFGIAVQLLEDPGSFSADNLLDLNAAILDNLTRSSGRHKKYLAPDFMKTSRTSRNALVPVSDEERARWLKEGDEINDRLTEELDPHVVIRSLLEQELLLHGSASRDSPVEEVVEEETETQTVPVDMPDEKKDDDEERESNE
ncbi:hypothetical protein ACLX1H_001762 [Fusarium chlamydosporum]